MRSFSILLLFLVNFCLCPPFGFAAPVEATVAGSTPYVTVAKSPAVGSQNIGTNIPNQPLGGFEVECQRTPVTVQKMVFRVGLSKASGNAPLLTNVVISDENGKVVAGPVNLQLSKENWELIFTDTVCFPMGKHTYTVRGTVGRAAVNGDTVAISTDPNTDWTSINEMDSGKSILLASGRFEMNAMTVKAGALSISVSLDPTSQTVPAGTVGYMFAHYQFDASMSGEDVRFSTLYLLLTMNGKAGGNPQDLNTMQLWDGNTPLNTGQYIVNPSAMSNGKGQNYQFTLDKPVTIPKGTVKTLTLKGNISSACPPGTCFSWGIDPTQNIAVTGATSSNDIPETVRDSLGQAQVVGPAITFGAPMPQPISSTYGPPDFSAVEDKDGIDWLVTKEYTTMDEIRQTIASSPPGIANRERVYRLWSRLGLLRSAITELMQPSSSSKPLPQEIVYRWYKVYSVRSQFDQFYQDWTRTSVMPPNYPR